MPGRKWLFVMLLGCLAPFDAPAADCNREDIEFYLNKGFTPGQITRLCTTETAGQTAGGYESVGPAGADANDPGTFLALAIDSDAVFVDDDKISFRHTACTERNRIQACPDMTLAIELTGLQITAAGSDSGGGGRIEIRGNIQRQINNYGSLPPAEQRLVDRSSSERHAVIPIKEGVDVGEARRALQRLVENANPPLIVSD
jgi:hypothetical protein